MKYRWNGPGMTLAQLEKMVGCIENGVVKPDTPVYNNVLQWCGRHRALSQGRRIHSHITSCNEHMLTLVLQNHLINMYGKCGSVDEAHRVFTSVRHLVNPISWNSMMAAYAQKGDIQAATLVFYEMHLEGMEVDKVSYTTVLSACSSPRSLRQALIIHGSIITRGLETDVILCTALVTAFSRCDSLENARSTFDAMSERNVVTWTAIISGYAQHGHLQEALELFWSMKDEAPNSVTFSTVINLCAEFGALEEGKKIHRYYEEVKGGIGDDQGDLVLGSLVSMYGRCGVVEEAFAVFKSMENPQLPSWTAIISACARNGRAHQALELFSSMTLEPDIGAFSAVLTACGDGLLLEDGIRVHEKLRGTGAEWSVQVGTSLLSMYGKCGELTEARKVFDSMPERNVVSWNAMLSSYLQQGEYEEVLVLHRLMLQHGFSPNAVSMLSAVNACSSLEHLMKLHGLAAEAGVDSEPQVCNALVSMYGKLGEADDAWKMFFRCTTRNAVTWNGLITCYARRRGAPDQLRGFHLLRLMHSEGVSPDRVTFISLCGILINLIAEIGCSPGSTRMVEELLTQVDAAGFEWDPVVGTGVIVLLGKCGRLQSAVGVFEGMCELRSDVVPWNAMISSYLEAGQWYQALLLLHQMQLQGIKPDLTCLVCTLGCVNLAQRICDSVEDWLIGEEVARQISVQNALINMYSKCGRIFKAEMIFNRMELRDVITWNVIIAGYIQAGRGEDAVAQFREMQLQGCSPDKVTYVNLLNGVDRAEMLPLGRHIHDRVVSQGLDKNIHVATALSTMYSKADRIPESAAVFAGMSYRNVVTWNAMIGAYAQSGRSALALHVFHSMQLEGERADTVTWINVLEACAAPAHAQVGRRVPAWIAESGCTSGSVENATVNMHAKCGNVAYARVAFDTMRYSRTIVSWSAMVAAYAQVGDVDEAFRYFHVMQTEGQRPNQITFVSLLGACSHAGVVQRGCECYHSMVLDHCLVPGHEHVGCVIDMLGRAGWTDAALRFAAAAERKPDAKAWMTLLAACSLVGDTTRGSNAAERVLQIDPRNAAAYIALSNTHAKPKNVQV